MKVSVNIGLVLCLFCAFPTVLGSAQKTYNFYKDVTKLAQAWIGAVNNFSESFDLHNHSSGGNEAVEVFNDPRMNEAYNQSLETLHQAKDAINKLTSIITRYSDAFRDILFDEKADIEERFGALLQKLNAHTGAIGESCTSLYKDNITRAVAEFAADIKSCADSAVPGSADQLNALSALMSLTAASIDMNVDPPPTAVQCKLDLVQVVVTKYAELKRLVDECLLGNESSN